jgi:hypothetical protein
MVREYTQRKEQTTEHNSDDDKSTDSDRSLTIYEKAYACFKPEPGESNAESAERHRSLEERVLELKQERKRKANSKTSTRIQNQFEMSPILRNTISNKQRRQTVRRNKATKKQSYDLQHESSTLSPETKQQEMTDCLKDGTLTTPSTNNTQSYTFEEAVAQFPDSRTITHQINVIMDTGATFTMLPGEYDFVDE